MKNTVFLSILVICYASLLPAQTVEDTWKNADYFVYGNSIYVHCLENKRTVHVRKYDINLSLVTEFQKTFDKEVLKAKGDDSYSVESADSTLQVRAQFSKSNDSYMGTSITLDLKLKEVKTESWEVGYPLLKTKINEKETPNTVNSNPMSGDIFEKDVKQKYELREVEHAISFYNKIDGTSIQLADYDGKYGRRFSGYYALKYSSEKNKVLSFNTYTFCPFQAVQNPKENDEEIYMEFYPDLIIYKDGNFLIPFSQKIDVVKAEKSSTMDSWGNAQRSTDYSHKVHMVGVGVLQLDPRDMSIRSSFRDKEFTRRIPHNEYIVGFKASDLNHYLIQTKNIHWWGPVKPTSCFLFTQYGLKATEDEHARLLIADPNSYIKFEFGKSSYRMEKVKL